MSPKGAELVVAILGVIASGCGDGESPIAPPAPGGETDRVLMSGAFDAPAADSFEDPGFHQPVLLEGRIPPTASGRRGDPLEVRLWDASRPDQICPSDHPLSGCVTIDWSADPGGSRVPASGVFDNSLTLEGSDGSFRLFLSEVRGLADTPDIYEPG